MPLADYPIEFDAPKVAAGERRTIVGTCRAPSGDFTAHHLSFAFPEWWVVSSLILDGVDMFATTVPVPADVFGREHVLNQRARSRAEISITVTNVTRVERRLAARLHPPRCACPECRAPRFPARHYPHG